MDTLGEPSMTEYANLPVGGGGSRNESPLLFGPKVLQGGIAGPYVAIFRREGLEGRENFSRSFSAEIFRPKVYGLSAFEKVVRTTGPEVLQK